MTIEPSDSYLTIMTVSPQSSARSAAQRRRTGRRFAMLGCLFIGIADFDQRRVAPRTANDLQARRQVLAGVSHRNDQGRPMQARRNPSGRTCGGRVAIAIELGWIACRRSDDRIDLGGIHRG